MSAAQASSRINSLDAMRGVAALSVVLWHWQHFLALATPPYTWLDNVASTVSRKDEPLYFILKPFYEHGDLAVDLFFVLSGFVFFFLYEQQISTRKATLADFAVYRFARLYPLYVATLVIAALLQWWFKASTGQFFIYPSNDLSHFVQNLGFLNHGGSFNAPSWSISVELVAYAVFAGLARFRLTRGWLVPLLVVGLGYEFSRIDPSISRAVSGFFMGGLTCRAFQAILALKRPRIIATAIGLFAVGGWAALMVACYALPDAYVGHDATSPYAGVAVNLIRFILFPLSVLSAALHERLLGGRYGPLAWLGQISYSSYLLHFPLQLCIALLVVGGLIPAAMVRSPVLLAAFYAILVPASALTYSHFEAPAQNAIRNRWRSSPWRSVPIAPVLGTQAPAPEHSGDSDKRV